MQCLNPEMGAGIISLRMIYPHKLIQLTFQHLKYMNLIIVMFQDTYVLIITYFILQQKVRASTAQQRHTERHQAFGGCSWGCLLASGKCSAETQRDQNDHYRTPRMGI